MYEGADEEDMLPTLSTSARYITGDKEGIVAVWRLIRNKHSELRLRLISLLDVAILQPSPVCTSVRSVSERAGTILIGTLGSEIFEVIDDNIPTLDVAFSTLTARRTLQKRLGIETSPLNISTTALLTSPVVASVTPTTNAAVPGPVPSGQILPSTNVDILKTGTLPLPLPSSATVTGTGTKSALPSNTVKAKSSLNITVSVAALRLVCGHYQGELCGLAVHPQLPLYISCGDDGLLCCWSLVQHKLLTYARLPAKLKCVDIDPTDGSQVAVALSGGAVWIIKTNLLFNPKNIPQTEIDFTLSGVEVDLSTEVVKAMSVLNLPQSQSLSQPVSVSDQNINVSNTKAISSLPPTVSTAPSAVAGTVSVTPSGVSAAAVVQTGALIPPITTTTVTASATTPINEKITSVRPNILILNAGISQRSTLLKYSFEGSILAVGSHDSSLDIYDVNAGYSLRRSAVGGMAGTDLITHIDYGVILVSTPDTFMKYDEINKKIITSELQAGKIVKSKAVMSSTESKVKVPLGSLTGSGIGSGGGSGSGSLDDQDRKKLKWVVTSTRDLRYTDICIQSATGAGEILYWNHNGSIILSKELIRVRNVMKYVYIHMILCNIRN